LSRYGFKLLIIGFIIYNYVSYYKLYINIINIDFMFNYNNKFLIRVFKKKFPATTY